MDDALARTHFSRDDRPTRLADVARSVDHVVCATELQSGELLYLSPRFIYGYQFGVGTPGELQLSTAVQASACLPGAFPARRLSAADAFAKVRDGREEMVLTDGGVYDNMADQWLVGLAARLQRQPDLPAPAAAVDEVVACLDQPSRMHGCGSRGRGSRRTGDPCSPSSHNLLGGALRASGLTSPGLLWGKREVVTVWTAMRPTARSMRGSLARLSL